MDPMAAKLLEAARRRGLSDYALAHLIGASESAVSRWRNGTRSISPDMRAKAARHFPELGDSFAQPEPAEAAS